MTQDQKQHLVAMVAAHMLEGQLKHLQTMLMHGTLAENLQASVDQAISAAIYLIDKVEDSI